MVDPYAGFAERYDLSFELFGENDPQLVEFFTRLFIQHNIHTVLDCACGTGRHLMLFHRLKCNVIGSDVSESMLRLAKTNLAGVGLELSLHQVDFRNLPGCFQQPFDAVVCLAAIGFMSGAAEFTAAFESMSQVLKPGGILILTSMPTDRQWKEKPRFMLTTNTPDFSRLFVIDYQANKTRFNILDIFHSREASDLKVWSAEISVLLRDDQEDYLKRAGFQNVDFYGGFDFSPYDKETSDNLITVACK